MSSDTSVDPVAVGVTDLRLRTRSGTNDVPHGVSFTIHRGEARREKALQRG